jgi:hypothetical protein
MPVMTKFGVFQGVILALPAGSHSETPAKQWSSEWDSETFRRGFDPTEKFPTTSGKPIPILDEIKRPDWASLSRRRNQCASGPFSPHADQTVAPSFMCADGGLRRGGSPGSASAGDTPGSNGPAVTRARRQLRTDATGPVLRHGRARANHNRPADRAAGRQTGPVGRRAVPARGRRSGHARTCAGYRQHAGDPAARQPRRRPHGPAEITPTAANTLSCAELLESWRSMRPSARQPWSLLQMVVEHDPEHDHRAGR